ncbi:MAG: hypothetical protein IJ468_13875 [Lachnospiraceae bacterium]|nr:hypothetical protein [Lachnospiraceae bacterium]
MSDKRKLLYGDFHVNSEEEPAKEGAEKILEKAEQSRDTQPEALTAEQLYQEHMQKQPSVLKLRLSLDMEGLEPEDYEVLQTYGKVERGITREVLVPADITLHALNYVILRAFGWQNSHLHQFRLPSDVFQKLTGGKNRADEYGYVEHDGLYTDWVKLCGLYFRFPCNDFEDLYWDDDYEDGENIKSWFRRKYTGPYRYDGKWEHYHVANKAAKSVITENPVIRERLSFAKWSELKKAGNEKALREERFKPIEKATLRDLEMGFEGRMDELLERIPLIELLIPQGISEEKELMRGLRFLQKYQERSTEELPVIPVAYELIYAYDYGDGWEVRIRLEEVYYTRDREEAAEENDVSGFVTAAGEEKEVPVEKEAFDRNNQAVDKMLALQIADAEMRRRPVCLSLDGLPLMDDVGGIHGYVGFLKVIHGSNSIEKKEMREWAKGMGWTGRMSKPETVL